MVALYVYIIKQQKRENSSWIGYLKAAETCQNQIKVRIEKDSFFERCNEVLEELLTEITSDITSRTRQEERRGSIREQEATTGSRSRTLHYSDQFNMTTTDERARRQLPEVTYGDDWQSIDFVSIFLRLLGHIINGVGSNCSRRWYSRIYGLDPSESSELYA